MSGRKNRDKAEPAALLAALAAWREATADFHGDRQLADRVLLATGWQCVPHEQGVRWHFGVNPEVSSWEPTHPHPVQSTDVAMGQMPFGWRVMRMAWRAGGGWHVIGEVPGSGAGRVHADGPSLAVALCVLAVIAWDLERKVDEAMADFAPANNAPANNARGNNGGNARENARGNAGENDDAGDAEENAA